MGCGTKHAACDDSVDPDMQEKLDDEIGLATLAGIDTAAT